MIPSKKTAPNNSYNTLPVQFKVKVLSFKIRLATVIETRFKNRQRIIAKRWQQLALGQGREIKMK